MDWQPMSSCPKDGTPFLAGTTLYTGGIAMEAVHFCKTRGWKVRGMITGDILPKEFDVWAPLPAAPSRSTPIYNLKDSSDV